MSTSTFVPLILGVTRLDALLNPALGPTLVWGLGAGTVASWIGHRYHAVVEEDGYEFAQLRAAACEACGHEITSAEASPIRSLKCSQCSAPLPHTWTATIVAVVVGCLAMLATWGQSWVTVPFMWLVPVVVTAALVDLRTMLIPKRLVWTGMAIGVASIAAVAISTGQPDTVLTALIGAVGYFTFLFIAHLISPGGMGFGDVRLSLVLGLYLGWIDIRLPLFGLLLGNLAYLLYAVPQRIARGRDAGRFSPFGPGLAIGTLLAVYLHPSLI